MSRKSIPIRRAILFLMQLRNCPLREMRRE